ncbi:MAG: phosphatidylserine decarboxylase [Candidatus Poseidoniaceae archaeon]|mgnify:FL=1|nr:phosphatidylserine decarboxylase [Candidatus Poseidoniaceae archaeon]
MSGLARGGHGPVLITFMMGTSAIIIGITIDSLNGLVHLFGILCWMISAFFVNFWRDPDRAIPSDEGILVSPADGHVMFARRERATGRRPSSKELEDSKIEDDSQTGTWYPEPLEEPLKFTTEQRFEVVKKGEESDTDVWRIAIFMSPLDVHVNRSPFESVIERMEHRVGKGRKRGPFLPAMKKESENNERVRTVFLAEDNTRIEVCQISGALARTIVPWLSIDTKVRRGQRYGMIRLGSRVDVRAPANKFKPAVVSAEAKDSQFPKGQFVQAGSTIIFNPANK